MNDFKNSSVPLFYSVDELAPIGELQKITLQMNESK